MKDLGEQLLDGLYGRLQIDEEWSVREPHRLSWWPCELRQQIWVEGPIQDWGFELWRAHVRTDVVKGLDPSGAGLEFLEATAKFATLSGYARPPEDKTRLQLASSMYFHEQTFEWVELMLAWTAPIQADEASKTCAAMAGVVHGNVDASGHPESGPRRDRDDILNIVPALVVPQGQEPSRYAGWEMNRMVELFKKPPSVLTTGDSNGIGVEFPFPFMTTLLQGVTGDPHPQLGNGMLSTLKLPDNPEGKLPESILEFNELELSSLSRSTFMGSWCRDPFGTIVYVSFLPNCLFSPSTIERMLSSQQMRARWITCDLLEYDWQEHYEEDVQKKLAMMQMLYASTDEPKNEGESGN